MMSGISFKIMQEWGFPGAAHFKELAWQCNPPNAGSIPGSGRSPGGRHGNFLPGKCHGQRSLAGYSPWGCPELDTTEATACTPNAGGGMRVKLGETGCQWVMST